MCTVHKPESCRKREFTLWETSGSLHSVGLENLGPPICDLDIERLRLGLDWDEVAIGIGMGIRSLHFGSLQSGGLENLGPPIWDLEFLGW